MHEIPEAIEEIEDRLAVAPFNAELHQALGVALIRRREFELALAALEYSSVLDPSDPFTFLYLGNWYFWQRDYLQALEQFRIAQRLVDVDPECEVSQDNLRRWYQQSA